jgi:glutamyl-tRNA reductase
MQINQLACLGISHHTASLELREYLGGLASMQRRNPAIQEMAVLATCNRVELYAYVEAPSDQVQWILADFLAQVHSRSDVAWREHTYFHTGEAVVQHLCRVAAGLDSLVIGEPQVLGQVSSAWQSAQQAHMVGPVLTLLFQTAVRAGKRARSETNISVNPASISSVAVHLAQQLTGDLRQRRVLVIGLGEMGELTLKALAGRGVTQIAVANRTRSKAEVTAAALGGAAYGLDELAEALATVDVVFSATNAPQPLIDAAHLQSVCRFRQGRPLLLFDLAVPRDIHPDVTQLPGVRHYTVDDLNANLDEALGSRRQEIPRVEAIITQELAGWQRQWHELAVKPVVVELRTRAEAVRRQTLARTLRFLGPVDEQTRAHLEHLTHALVNHLLHEPTVRLKQMAGDPEVTEHTAAFRNLFGLGE